ncbi:hypothetical protein [Ekhidna sp.]
MSKLLSTVGYIGLSITLIAPILYFMEMITLDWNHKIMLLGTVLWLAVSVFKDQMKHKA